MSAMQFTILLLVMMMTALPTISPFNYSIPDRIENCPNVKCDLCFGQHLVCTSPGLDKFPTDSISHHHYTYVKIEFADFSDPSLTQNLIVSFKRVVYFQITHSNLDEVRRFTFKGMTLLNYLNLSYNRLGIIHDFAFHGLNLDTLLLNDNSDLQLQRRAFDGLQVKRLSLANNKMRLISFRNFQNLFDQLEILFLHENNMQYVSQEFEPHFANVHRLQILSLGKNPMKCRCRNLWLIKILKFRLLNQRKHPDLQNNLSMYPKCQELNNSFVYVKEKDLQCEKPYSQSLFFTLKSGCQIFLTCSSKDSDGTISWLYHDSEGSNPETIVGTQNDYAIFKQSQTSSILYVKRLRSQNETFECRINSPLKSAGIKIESSGNECNGEAEHVHISSSIIVVIIVTISTVTTMGICLLIVKLYRCRQRHVKERKSIIPTLPSAFTYYSPPPATLPHHADNALALQQQTQSLLQPTELMLPAPAAQLHAEAQQTDIYYDYPSRANISLPEFVNTYMIT